MASRKVSTLKFVGTVSLGLLTGLSYTLSTLTVPTLLSLPSASSASRAFTSLSTLSPNHLTALTSISSASFFLAYLLSPRSQKHPYLLWTTMIVASSGLTHLVFKPTVREKKTAPKRNNKGKARQMDASYEVLGASDRDSEGTVSGEETEEDVNGEDVREQMEGFMKRQIATTVLAGVGFAMSVIGIWGDGAADMVVIEM
ncbi:Autophagy-related protein [Lachnellula occidentalis]|uniref:Autophagy-related protein n=1 Tax=Lachnellula occidentalis TaxID=215460 RepID=A0A8H8UEC8_9HELO|nr:Autophagy-related protein [Lachnellula occidentalis]